MALIKTKTRMLRENFEPTGNVLGTVTAACLPFNDDAPTFIRRWAPFKSNLTVS